MTAIRNDKYYILLETQEWKHKVFVTFRVSVVILHQGKYPSFDKRVRN